MRPINSPSPAVIPLSVLAGRSGGDLRLAIDLLLQENAFISAMAMDAATNARLDRLIAASASLDDNETTLAEIVGAVKGAAASESLLDALRAESAAFVSYAQSDRSTPPAGLDALQSVVATQLSVPEATLRQRSDAQVVLEESLASHDSASSAQRLVSLASMSDSLGEPAAAEMAAHLPELSPRSSEGADVDLRLHIALSLQSQTYFSAMALDAAADGRGGDAQAYAAAAHQAAIELGGALEDSSPAALTTGVADRLDGQLNAFIAAASGGDRQQASVDIDRLRRELDALLSSANPLIAPGLLSQQMRQVDQPLLTAADAFAAHDYATAYAREREAARATRKPADTLALAMIDRHPGRYLNLTPPTPQTPE